ncbi:MAG: N-acetylgalactosamine-6-sulfatase, partial [Planctomycetota bacterium]
SREAPIFFRRPPDRDAFYGVDDLPDLAVRDGRFKLLCEYDGTNAELYDLESDPGETNDIAEIHPDVVQELKAAALSWHAAVPADAGEALRRK